MEKLEFVKQLELLTSNEDVLSVSREINELRSQFEDFCLEQDRLKQVALLEAQERGEIVEFTNEPDSLKDHFYSLFNEYKEKRNKISTERKLEQESNLRKKRHLIEKLQNLITSEENIGAAIESYKEIHEAWKSVGAIPREKAQDIQSEFSKLVESFFFNIKIYRELKEHDLRRNLQLKEELVIKINALAQIDKIKEVEALIKVYQNEFDEIGPVITEEWEQLKEKYWTSVKAVYARINDFYEAKREQQKQNLEKKRVLISDLQNFVSTASVYKTVKEWDEATKELMKFQDLWKTTGLASKKENEELWKSFRSECDTFFDLKRTFFKGIEEVYTQISIKKQEIISKANELKSSTDWKQASESLIRLQQNWKKLGSAGPRFEQKLWKDFREACDTFFENKKQFFELEDLKNQENLTAKKELIAAIEKYVISDDKTKVLNDLKEFTNRFNAIGKVPFKEKDVVFQSYKKAIDAVYASIKLEGEEKEKVMFEAHLETLKANPNASKLIEKERKELELVIAKHQQEINQLENNLGFISRSKAGDALRKEVESKISRAKNQIKEFKNKAKLLVNE